MPLNDTYLSVLKQKNKGLFYIILFYIIVSLTFALRNEMTFFFRWSMYSKPHEPREVFPVAVLEYNNGKVFNDPFTWHDHKKMMFYYTILHYKETVDNNGRELNQDRAEQIAAHLLLPALPYSKLYTTPSELAAYPAWLMRYMQANMCQKIDSINVYWLLLQYKSSGRVEVVDKQLIFKQ